MKKLLSVILAGAMAVTAVSPVLASSDAYKTAQTGDKYYDFSYSDSACTDVASYTSTGSNGYLSLTGTASLTNDVVKGQVAKLDGSASVNLVKGNDKTPYNDKSNGIYTRQTVVYELDFLAPSGATVSMTVPDLYSGEMFTLKADGSIVTRNKMPDGSGETSAKWEQGVWNHLTVLQYTYTNHQSYGELDVNAAEYYLNGTLIGSAGNSGGRVNFSNETWNNAKITFNAGEGSTYVTGFAKYETTEATSRSDCVSKPYSISPTYLVADTGDVASELTSSNTAMARVNSGTVFYKDTVANATNLVKYLTASNSGSIEVYYNAGDGEAKAASDEYDDVEIGWITKLIALSASGDVCTYYGVEQMASLDVTFASTITENSVEMTLAFAEADIATLADLKTAIACGSGVSFKAYKGDTEIANDTDSLVGITKVVVADADQSATYTVNYRTNTIVYVDFDANDYASYSEMSAALTENNSVLWWRHNGNDADLVDDAELGKKVLKFTAKGSIWGGLDAGADYQTDVKPGDTVVVEATVQAPMTVTNADRIAFGATELYKFNESDEIETMCGLSAGTRYKYTPGAWYHIVTTFYLTDTGCYPIYTYVNGEQGGSSHWPRSNGSMNYNWWNTSGSGSGKSAFRLMMNDSMAVSSVKVWSTNKGYAEGDDAVTLTSKDASVIVDSTAKSIGFTDGTMTVADLLNALEAGGSANAFKADGTKLAAEAAATDAAYVSVTSKSGVRVVRYATSFKDVVSSKYTVGTSTIEGVLQFTTKDQFLKNVAIDGDYELTMAGKYIADGDVLATDNAEYQIKLAKEAHNTGSVLTGTAPSDATLPSGSSKGAYKAEEDGIHISLDVATVTTVTDAVRGSSVYKLVRTNDGLNTRWNLVANDITNNGNGYGKLAEDEIVNIEFAVMGPDGINGGIVANSNWTFFIKDGVIGINQNATVPVPTGRKYTNGEWMHVAVSMKAASQGGIDSKIYIDGVLAYEGHSTTNNKGSGLSLQLGAGVSSGTLYMDDIRYYKSETWGFDADYKYGAGVKSAKSDVIVANEEIWITGDSTLADAVTAAATDVNGNALNLANVNEGEKIYVKTDEIIRGYTVKSEIPGWAVDASAKTISVNIGSVDDTKNASVFAAGLDTNGKFTTIKKYSKASYTDDVITVDFTELNATKAKLFAWDSSLSSLFNSVTVELDGEGLLGYAD